MFGKGTKPTIGFSRREKRQSQNSELVKKSSRESSNEKSSSDSLKEKTKLLKKENLKKIKEIKKKTSKKISKDRTNKYSFLKDDVEEVNGDDDGREYEVDTHYSLPYW